MFSIHEGKTIYDIKNVFDDSITNIKVSSCGTRIAASSVDGDYVKILDIRKNNKTLFELGNSNYHNGHDYNKICYGPGDEWVIGGAG